MNQEHYDLFEPTHRPNEPLFSFEWTDGIVIILFAGFFALIAVKIFYGN